MPPSYNTGAWGARHPAPRTAHAPRPKGDARALMPLALFVRWLSRVSGRARPPTFWGDAVAVRRH
eukprot:6226343-Alexandrium_andersonii.AAC.1